MIEKLNFRQFGSGKDIIILHGLLGSLDNRISDAHKLATNYKVTILDLPNHGKSYHSDLFSYKDIADSLNNFIKDTDMAEMSLEEIISKSSTDKSMIGIFNNASQHWNHNLFWKCMKPNGGGSIPPNLEKRLISDFGSIEEFKNKFKEAGVNQFGSGWCWLSIDNGKLVVSKTANAANPLIENMKPILGCDVWEHSYYIDYRNARPKYLEAWFDNLINWEYVNELFESAT